MISSAWHILALVLSAGFVVMFYYLAKLLSQINHTLKTLENTLTELQQEVFPVISNVEGITDNVEQMTERADIIIETIQNKTVDTMSIIDSIKKGFDVFKHSMFLVLNHFSRYFRGISVGVKVGLKHFRGSEDDISEKSELVLAETIDKKNIKGIVDHLEKVNLK